MPCCASECTEPQILSPSYVFTHPISNLNSFRVVLKRSWSETVFAQKNFPCHMLHQGFETLLTWGNNTQIGHNLPATEQQIPNVRFRIQISHQHTSNPEPEPSYWNMAVISPHFSLVFPGTQIFSVSKLRVYTTNTKFELIPCRAKA